MAITPSDFSKIWASNADTPEYTFNEADYLKGWDFVGNLPPTRAMWNAMQKSTDEKMKYVFDNFGAPLLANTVAEMTMQNRVYVYTGGETGYTAGHWYYWNGTAWTDGGVYNSNTVQVDPTLTISGAAADAKVTGDSISALNTQIQGLHSVAICGALNSQNTLHGVDVKVCGCVVELNGTVSGTTNNTRLFSLQEKPAKGYTSSNITNCTVSNTLLGGHTYRLHAVLVSGTFTIGSTTYNAGYRFNGTNQRITLHTFENGHNVYAAYATFDGREITPETDVTVGALTLVFVGGRIFNNAVIVAYVEDVTVSNNLDPTTKNALETIDKKLIDSKSEENIAFHTLEQSDGNLRYLSVATPQKDLQTYVEQDGSIVAGDVTWGTDYVKVNNGDVFYIRMINDGTSTGLQNSGVFFYVYDENKNIVWDYVNSTASASWGYRKNLFSSNLASKGWMFSGIPAGYYVRTGIFNITSSHICSYEWFVWNGKRFGSAVVTAPKSFNGTTRTVYPSDGLVSFVVDNDAEYVFCDRAYTIVNIVRVNESTKNDKNEYGGMTLVPTQMIKVPHDTDAEAIVITIAKNYDYDAGTWDKVSDTGDLSNHIFILSKSKLYFDTLVGGVSTFDIKAKIARIVHTQWSPQKEVHPAGSAYTLKQGVTYNGIPYGSHWKRGDFVGWHVSVHTFLNAVNDEDSIFYGPASFAVSGGNGTHAGAYYSNVCSSFGTLVTGFPCPLTNYGLMHHPDVNISMSNEILTGTLLSNGIGHCMIPLEKCCSRNNSSMDQSDFVDGRYFVVVEQISPYTLMNKRYGHIGISTSTNSIGNATGRDLQNYRFYCNYTGRFQNPPYSLVNGSDRIVNGSARPYRGDRSVYTSAMDVRVNIKDNTATKLYYALSTYANDSFTVVGATQEVDINGATYINIDKTTLVDGGIYSVWTDADEVKEHFEYHDVSVPFTYNIVDGVLKVTDAREFWYIFSNAKDEKNVAGNMSILYDPLGYERYKRCANVTSLQAVFFKGTLGAYTMPLSRDEEDVQPDEEEN